jgi:hypothetical protein
VALLGVLAGLGSDAVLTRLGDRRAARALAAAALAAGVGSVGASWWWLEARYLAEPTARRQAIEWVERTAPLGASVKLLEGHFARLEGRLPDRARFRVRHGELGPHRFDYYIVAGETPPPLPLEPVEKYVFRGRAVCGTTTAYSVYRLPPEAGEWPDL